MIIQMCIHVSTDESLASSTPMSNIHAQASIPNKPIFYESDGLVAVSFIVRFSRQSLARIGFIDPREVIQDLRLIPAFAYDKTSNLLSHSIARNPREKDLDWKLRAPNLLVEYLLSKESSRSEGRTDVPPDSGPGIEERIGEIRI